MDDSTRVLAVQKLEAMNFEVNPRNHIFFQDLATNLLHNCSNISGRTQLPSDFRGQILTEVVVSPYEEGGRASPSVDYDYLTTPVIWL